jgi:hypothetical protein
MTSALRGYSGPGVSSSQAEQTLQRRSGMPVNISATAAQEVCGGKKLSLDAGWRPGGANKKPA